MGPSEFRFLEPSLSIKLIFGFPCGACELRVSHDLLGHQRNKYLWRYTGCSWFGGANVGNFAKRALHPLWNVSQGLLCPFHLLQARPFLPEACRSHAPFRCCQCDSPHGLSDGYQAVRAKHSSTSLQYTQVLLVGETNDLQFNKVAFCSGIFCLLRIYLSGEKLSGLFLFSLL